MNLTREGWTNLVIKDELKDKLEERINKEYTSQRRKPQLSTYIQDLLWEVIESDEILRRYGPFLEEDAIEPDRVFIKDNRLRRTAELTIESGDLYCDIDQSLNCVHIGFAWAIPRVYKAMDLHGKKMPKIQ